MTTATRTSTMTGPAAPEAEMVVLGTVLHVSVAHDDVARHLTVADFDDPHHQTILEAAQRLYRDGKPCGEVAVSQLLRAEGTLDRIGNTVYLSTLLDYSQPSSLDYYVNEVRQAAVKRRLIAVQTRGIQQAQDGSGTDANTLLASVQAEIDALVAGQVREHNRGEDLLDIVSAQMFDWQHGTDGPHTPTYLAALDARLGGGLYPSTLNLIAARTSVGKTALALQIAVNVAVRAEERLPVLYVNLEMSNKGLARRVLSNLAGVNYGRIINGSAEDTGLTPEDHAKIAAVLPSLAAAPLRIVDCSSLTPAELRAMVKAYRREMGGKLGLVIVDHAGLMTPDTGVSHNRNADQGRISRALKTLAKAEEIPVLALVQINRAGDSGSDNTPPRLTHLKDSGSLEEDADAVIVMHRDEIADRNTARVGEADLILRKARDGERDTVAVVSFQGHYQRIESFPEE